MAKLRECKVDDLDPVVQARLKTVISEEEKVLLCNEWSSKNLVGRLNDYFVEIITEKQVISSSKFLSISSPKYGDASIWAKPIQPDTTIFRRYQENYYGYTVELLGADFIFFQDKAAADRFVSTFNQAKDAVVARQAEAESRAKLPRNKEAIGTDTPNNLSVGHDLVGGDKIIHGDSMNADTIIIHKGSDFANPQNKPGVTLALDLFRLLDPFVKSFERIRPSEPTDLREMLERFDEVKAKAKEFDPYFDLSEEMEQSLYLIQKTLNAYAQQIEQYLKASLIVEQDQERGRAYAAHEAEFVRTSNNAVGSGRQKRADKINEEIKKIKTMLRAYIKSNS